MMKNFSLFGAATLPLPSCPAECKQLVTLAETSHCEVMEQVQAQRSLERRGKLREQVGYDPGSNPPEPEGGGDEEI